MAIVMTFTLYQLQEHSDASDQDANGTSGSVLPPKVSICEKVSIASSTFTYIQTRADIVDAGDRRYSIHFMMQYKAGHSIRWLCWGPEGLPRATSINVASSQTPGEPQKGPKDHSTSKQGSSWSFAWSGYRASHPSLTG